MEVLYTVWFYSEKEVPDIGKAEKSKTLKGAEILVQKEEARKQYICVWLFATPWMVGSSVHRLLQARILE